MAEKDGGRCKGLCRQKRAKKKSPEILELLGHALGCIGISFDDFCKSTPEELEWIFKSWNELQESETHGSWERMRLHAVMTMQPHCKKKLQPEDILPFPWEKKNKFNRNSDQSEPVLSKADQKKRVAQVASRL